MVDNLPSRQQPLSLCYCHVWVQPSDGFYEPSLWRFRFHYINAGSSLSSLVHPSKLPSQLHDWQIWSSNPNHHWISVFYSRSVGPIFRLRQWKFILDYYYWLIHICLRTGFLNLSSTKNRQYLVRRQGKSNLHNNRQSGNPNRISRRVYPSSTIRLGSTGRRLFRRKMAAVQTWNIHLYVLAVSDHNRDVHSYHDSHSE